MLFISYKFATFADKILNEQFRILGLYAWGTPDYAHYKCITWFFQAEINLLFTAADRHDVIINPLPKAVR